MELARLLAPDFPRCDLRSNAMAYVRGLLTPGVAGNCWALAQAIGHARPYRLQHLLSGAVWDEDAVRDTVRAFVGRHLGDGGVLIFDETGDLKKGQATAGSGGSTPAPPVGSRTPSSRSTPPTPQRTGTH